MRRTIYAFILILLISPNVMANENSRAFEFSFNCKILDQLVLGVTDGKSERYNGFKDGSIIGDTFKLDFIYLEFQKGGYALAITSDHKDLVLDSLIYDSGLMEIREEQFSWKDTSAYQQRVSKNIINIT